MEIVFILKSIRIFQIRRSNIYQDVSETGGPVWEASKRVKN